MRLERGRTNSCFKIYSWKDAVIKHGLVDVSQIRQRVVVHHGHGAFAGLAAPHRRHAAAMTATWRSHKPLAAVAALVRRMLPSSPLGQTTSRRRHRKPEVVNDVGATVVQDVVEGARQHFRSGWRLRQNLRACADVSASSISRDAIQQKLWNLLSLCSHTTFRTAMQNWERVNSTAEMWDVSETEMNWRNLSIYCTLVSNRRVKTDGFKNKI